MNPLERYAELLGQHLRERGGMALPVIEGACDDRHCSVRLETDPTHLLAGRCSAFEKAADAKAAQLSPPAALTFTAGKTFCIGDFERMLEHAGEVSAVIRAAGGGL